MKDSVKLIPRELKDHDFPSASYLSKEQQTTYEDACKQFSNKKARQTLNISQKGSNLFKVLLLNQIGIITATLSELDLIAEQNPKFLKGFYEDSPSVVLRSTGDSYSDNDYLAKSLAKITRKRKFNQPIIINGLKIKEDSSSPYGLNFEAEDSLEIITAPDFSHKNNQKKFSRINPDYTIEFDNQASRILYTRDNGLSRLNVDWDLNLNSSWNKLADSGSSGRVVIVSAEGTSQKNLDDYTNKLSQERDKQIQEVQDRFKQAEDILRGE